MRWNKEPSFAPTWLASSAGEVGAEELPEEEADPEDGLLPLSPDCCFAVWACLH